VSAKAPSKISSITQTLAAYIAASPRKALPKAVLEKTKHHILDTLAAMVSGSKLPPGKAALAYAKTLGGTKQATVAGSRLLTTPVNAALANAMMAHADETDDSHAPSMMHPGCAIVANALAFSELHHRNGNALLRAVALGYDVGARLNISLGEAAFRRVGHLTHCFGPTFGSTAASAALCGFSPKQVRYALAYAAQQAGGLSSYARDTGHIEKAFDFGGMPARNGATAVSMVAAGCTATDDILFGERSFYAAYDESARTGRAPDPSILISDLGKRFEIMRTNIKRWTVGSPIQAPLDSLLTLIREHRIQAADVEKLVVRVSVTGANTTGDREMPDICMQHMCAVMLLDGIATFESAHDEKRMKNPKVLAMRKRIELIGDEALQKKLPQRQGIVEITLRDGRTVRHHTEAVRGTADNPMTRAEVDEKCHHLMTPVLGAKKSRALCDAIWQLEKLADARKLRPLLQC
jgi:2-methylcitrate dehydratase PrpD